MIILTGLALVSDFLLIYIFDPVFVWLRYLIQALAQSQFIADTLLIYIYFRGPTIDFKASQAFGPDTYLRSFLVLELREFLFEVRPDSDIIFYDISAQKILEKIFS